MFAASHHTIYLSQKYIFIGILYLSATWKQHNYHGGILLGFFFDRNHV